MWPSNESFRDMLSYIKGLISHPGSSLVGGPDSASLPDPTGEPYAQDYQGEGQCDPKEGYEGKLSAR